MLVQAKRILFNYINMQIANTSLYILPGMSLLIFVTHLSLLTDTLKSDISNTCVYEFITINTKNVNANSTSGHCIQKLYSIFLVFSNIEKIIYICK